MGYKHFNFKQGSKCKPGTIHFRPHHIERVYIILSVGSSDLELIGEAMHKRWKNFDDSNDGWYSQHFLTENTKFMLRLPEFPPETMIKIVPDLDEICHYPGCMGTETKECKEAEPLDDFCKELGLELDEEYTLSELLKRFKFQYWKEEYRAAQRREERAKRKKALIEKYSEELITHTS